MPETVAIHGTYIRGLEKHRHWEKRLGKAGAHAKRATRIGAVARKANVICEAVDGQASRMRTSFWPAASLTKTDLDSRRGKNSRSGRFGISDFQIAIGLIGHRGNGD